MEWRPEFGAGREDVLEVVGHDADNGVERVVETDLGADDAGVASEAALPQSVAEDGDVRAPEGVVRGLKGAAHDGRDTQNLEVPCADALAFEALGLIASGHGRLPRHHDGGGVEGVTAVGESAKGAESDVDGCAGAGHLPKHHDAVGLGIGQRIEEDRFDRAEDGCACADSDPEDENRRGGEGGRFAQLTQCEAEIVAEAGETERGVDAIHLFFGCGWISKAEGGVTEGVVSRHSGGDVVLGPHGEVCGQFGFNFVIDLRTAKEISDALIEGHDRSP